MAASLSRRSKGLSENMGTNVSSDDPNFGEILSTELWVMIFELLFVGNAPPIATKSYHLRLVSKRFDGIATPIIYRNFVLSRKLVGSRPDPLSARIVAMLKTYTRLFIVSDSRSLSGYWLAKFLADCRALQEVSWICFNETPYCLPAPVQNAFKHDLIQVRLNLTILSQTFRPELIPSANLSALELWYDLRFEQRGGERLNALVAASTQLEMLRVPRGIHFSPIYGKLSALKKLIIPGPWSYKPEEVGKIWDFSRLETLELESELDIPSFVDSVQASTFDALRKLDAAENELYSKRAQASSSTKLSDFISRLDQLHQVSAATYDPEKIINSLAKHKNTLTKLDISTPLAGDILSRVRLKQARAILVTYPRLTELKIELHVPPPELDAVQSMKFIKNSINILAGFKCLRRLCIRYRASRPALLYYSKFAYNLMQRLRTRKEGISLQYLSIRLKSPVWEGDFENATIYEWDADGQLIFSKTHFQGEDETSSEDGTSGEDSD